MFHEIDTKKLGARGEAMAAPVQACVHCGFCLPACPTYQELGQEMDSPRGRIILMKNVLEGHLDAATAQPHIDRCLGCLACVTACPSGVHYGDLVSSYRDEIRQEGKSKTTLTNWLASITLPYPARFRMAVRMGALFRPLHRFMPKQLRPMLDMIPQELPKAQPVAEVSAAEGTRRGRVALLAGCAQQVLAPEINAATVRVLTRNHIEVVVPKGMGCCGALAWHVGHGDEAMGFAKRLIDVVPADVDCLVINAAGCGSAVQEYPLLLAGTDYEDKAKQLAAKTMDISVYLDGLELEPIPKLSAPLRLAYHDACHLAHAQGVRSAPRRLLERVPGLEVVSLADGETCCGSAGTYNIEQPEIARSLGDRKAAAILETRAPLVASGNIGCLVQMVKHLRNRTDRVTILHTVQVIDRAYQKILA